MALQTAVADVKSYIDEHYVEAVRASEYERGDDRRSIFDRRRQEVERASSRVMEDTCMLMETQYEPSAAMAGKRSMDGSFYSWVQTGRNASMQTLRKEIRTHFSLK